MDQGKVLIAAPVHKILSEGLESAGYELLVDEAITQAKAYMLLTECVGVITSTRLQLDKALLDAAPQLRWIGRMGSGMEVIDLEYAQSRGIACFGSPEGNCNAVGEHALGMLLSLTKRIAWSWKEIGEGKWIRDANRGIELEGKTVGIIGFGHTGQAFARKLSGFDGRILAYDKYCPEKTEGWAVINAKLDQIFDEADIISFHVPFQKDTIRYFDEAFIAKMKRPFILVNTSRGAVVDTKAMYQGLLSGKITGACLDVLEQEPLEKMDESLKMLASSLAKMPQVVLTPHIAGYSEEALLKMSKVLLKHIVIGR